MFNVVLKTTVSEVWFYRLFRDDCSQLYYEKSSNRLQSQNCENKESGLLGKSSQGQRRLKQRSSTRGEDGSVLIHPLINLKDNEIEPMAAVRWNVS